MARIAKKWLTHLNIFEICKTPHLVELSLPLVLITAIGFATPRAWSQDNASPQEKPDTSSKNTTAEENAEVQSLSTISDEAPATLPNTNSMLPPADTAPLEKETASQTATPPLSAGMKSTSQPSTPDTTADGTVSVVIQPDNMTPPPTATKTTSTVPPAEPRNSVTSVHSENASCVRKNDCDNVAGRDS